MTGKNQVFCDGELFAAGTQKEKSAVKITALFSLFSTVCRNTFLWIAGTVFPCEIICTDLFELVGIIHRKRSYAQIQDGKKILSFKMPGQYL